MSKIALVDSSETFARYLGRVISALGYEIEYAFDIDAGFDLISSCRPDLVITERHFPNHCGLDLCRELKEDPLTAGIPVVIVSTDGTGDTMQKAEQSGCADYLTKPLTVRDINLMLQRNLPFTVKRRAIRLNISVDVVVVAEGRRIETKTTTLGEGGMLVRSDSDVFREGVPLEISIWLQPHGDPVILAGEVLYVSEAAGPFSQRGVGIKFIEVAKGTAEQLAQYLERAIS